jgi:PKD repeat protein
LQTTLIWGSVISATSYDIQVSTNSQFIDPLYGFMDLVSTAKTLTNLNYNTTYYWRVRAKNSGSLSDWSDIWNFTTQNATGTAPIANYTASPLTTIIGQSVQFTDLSTNTPTSWLWNFGDGGTSTLQNPSHSYNVAGTYTVSLKTTNSFGDNTKTMSNYIIINSTSMPDGLVAYYPFNGNANDESGNGLNLTTKGTPTLTVSRKNLPNSAFSLNGTTDYFIRASNTLLLPTNEFSMCAWVYSTGIDGIQDVIISTLGNSAGNGYQMHLDNTNNTIGGFMRRTDATYVDLQNPVSSYLNNWTFVVFTYSNVTGTKLYLNNQLKKETTNLFQIQYGNINDFYVGTNYNLSLGAARMFKGKIDDIRIYNKALSPSEIDLLFKE